MQAECDKGGGGKDGALEQRLAALEARLFALPHNLPPAALLDPPLARAAAALRALPGSALLRVPPGYYGLPLARRAALLRAHPATLCKTLLLVHAAGRVAVVVQYAARLDMAALARALGGAPGLALEPAGEAVGGFPFNGVCPLGLRTPHRLVLCAGAARAAREYGGGALWAGGGAPDVKARLFVGPLLAAGGAVAMDVSTPRAGEGEEA